MTSKTAKVKKKFVSIVIPTYNERENIRMLVPRIFRVFKRERIKGEVIIVDDNSPDGTGEIAEKLKNKYSLKVIHREKKSGLSSAVLEGFRKADGEIIGVMDADLSHPPEYIPDFVRPIIRKEADLVIGSRRVKGGGIRGWPLSRIIISRSAAMLAKGLTKAKDPMSGFFFFNRKIMNSIELKPSGYKIGLEIIVKGKYDKMKEIPYVFVNRKEGKSKLGFMETLRYFYHLFRLYWYKKSHKKQKALPI